MSQSSFFLLLICFSVLTEPVHALSRGAFVNPLPGSVNMYSQADPAVQFVYLLGSSVNVTWQTTFKQYSCTLSQQSLSQFSASASDTPLYSGHIPFSWYRKQADLLTAKSTTAPEQGGFQWTVNTAFFDLTSSPLFYLTCTSDEPGNGNQNQAFQSYFFNMTSDPNDPRLAITNRVQQRVLAVNNLLMGNGTIPTRDGLVNSTSSICTAPNGTAFVQPSCPPAPTITPDAKLGVGIGIGAGVPIIGLLTYALLRSVRLNSRNKPALNEPRTSKASAASSAAPNYYAYAPPPQYPRVSLCYC